MTIGIDIETLDPQLTDRGPSWIWDEGEILVTGVYYSDTQRKEALQSGGGKKVHDWLLDPKVTMIGANLAYDIGWLLEHHSISAKFLQCELIDVQLAESFIDEHQPFSLDDLARKYLRESKGYGDLPSFCLSRGLRGDFRKHLGTLWHEADSKQRKINREKITSYVLSDADQPCRIWEQQKAILLQQGLMPAFEMNTKVLRTCIELRQRGVRINHEQWKKNCDMVKPIHERLEKQFFEKWGEVNINSPKQLGEFMDRNNVVYKCRVTIRGWEPDDGKYVKAEHEFSGEEARKQMKRLHEEFPGVAVVKGKLVYETQKKYAARVVQQLETMGYNVICGPMLDKFFIKENKALYPVVADLEQYKTATAIISKFLGPKFARFLTWHDGECTLHPSFNPVGARTTSRMSSNAPNCQNIPSKCVLFAGTEHEVDLTVLCREVFIPRQGQIWLKLDLSGQELRWIAHFAPGKSGVKARQLYNDNPRFDEHGYVAEVSGLAAKHGPSIGRKFAKGTKFGRAYGAGKKTIARNNGWTEEFAEEMIETIDAASPWLPDLMHGVQDTAKKRGYIKSVLGRRMHLKPTGETYSMLNSLIQGSSADQTKAAISQMAETSTVETLELTVHDEVDFSLPMNAQGYERMLQLKEIFENAVPADVPFISDPELGSDFAHLEGQKEGESMRQFWNRMCKAVREGEKIRERTFDLDVLDEPEDDDE